MSKLIWSDEFDYEGPPDAAKWRLESGGHGWGNEELQFYTDRADSDTANAWVSDGKLHIRLRCEDYDGRKYTSARLNSKASWQYGRIDVSAKLPKGSGTWPAIWMLGDTIHERGWPSCGEIDIMEHVGRTQDIVHFSLHSGKYNHALDTHLTFTKKFTRVSDTFNVYSIDWKKDKISFLFNDEVFVEWHKRADEADGDTEGWPFNAPFYMLLNVAYGGTFGGAQDDACLPQSMEIEYVRVYRNE